MQEEVPAWFCPLRNFDTSFYNKEEYSSSRILIKNNFSSADVQNKYSFSDMGKKPLGINTVKENIIPDAL